MREYAYEVNAMLRFHHERRGRGEGDRGAAGHCDVTFAPEMINKARATAPSATASAEVAAAREE